MGNVQQKGREDGLTKFQTRKLKYEFCTFFGDNIVKARNNGIYYILCLFL